MICKTKQLERNQILNNKQIVKAQRPMNYHAAIKNDNYAERVGTRKKCL